jgi:hypothetical protein
MDEPKVGTEAWWREHRATVETTEDDLRVALIVIFGEVTASEAKREAFIMEVRAMKAERDATRDAG